MFYLLLVLEQIYVTNYLAFVEKYLLQWVPTRLVGIERMSACAQFGVQTEIGMIAR